MTVLYGVWLLLPLSFFLLAVWAVLKPVFKVHGQEYYGDYFKQGLFCSIGLALAIVIHQSDGFNNFIEAYSHRWFNLSIASWLLYPSILVVMAYINRSIQRYRGVEEESRVLPEDKRFITN